MLKPTALRLLPLRRIALMLACLTTTTLAMAQSPVNDPPVSAATNLGSVLQTISERSPDVLAARAGRAQADALVQQARAAWFGKVDAYALSQHFNDPRLTRPITQPPNVANYPFSSDQFGYGVNAQLPIDISGQIAAEVDAARARAAGAQWSAEDVRLRALLQGATLFRNLQALAGQRQALDKQLQALKKSERVAETGLKVGNIARVNLLRVQAAVAAVQAQIAGVDGQDRKARAQLAALMGVPEFKAAVPVPDSGPAQVPANPDLPAPAIQAAQSAFEASQDKVRAAERAMLPQFAVTGGWNHNAVQWNTQPVDTWQINLGVTLNLWSGGAQKSAIDAAQATAIQSQQQLKAAQDNLRAARDGAVALWSAQDQSWHAAESGLRAAAESARIEQDRFKNGLGSATDLIDAEAALAWARASVAGALSGWWQADDALRYAYGEPPAALQAVDSTSSSTQP
ncbi:MAG: TolC family protein [Halothiobacillus sp.]|jgi:outer membrane protein TolC|nr:TolC family protein [Halothiobacillus sp.]